MIALGDGQKGPYRNAPVAWQQPTREGGECPKGSVRPGATGASGSAPPSMTDPSFSRQDDTSSRLHSNSKGAVLVDTGGDLVDEETRLEVVLKTAADQVAAPLPGGEPGNREPRPSTTSR